MTKFKVGDLVVVDFPTLILPFRGKIGKIVEISPQNDMTNDYYEYVIKYDKNEGVLCTGAELKLANEKVVFS